MATLDDVECCCEQPQPDIRQSIAAGLGGDAGLRMRRGSNTSIVSVDSDYTPQVRDNHDDSYHGGSRAPVMRAARRSMDFSDGGSETESENGDYYHAGAAGRVRVHNNPAATTHQRHSSGQLDAAEAASHMQQLAQQLERLTDSVRSLQKAVKYGGSSRSPSRMQDGRAASSSGVPYRGNAGGAQPS